MDGIREVFETRDGKIWLERQEAILHHQRILAKQDAIRSWFEDRGLPGVGEEDPETLFCHLIDVLLFRNEGLSEILHTPLEDFV